MQLYKKILSPLISCSQGAIVRCIAAIDGRERRSGYWN